MCKSQWTYITCTALGCLVLLLYVLPLNRQWSTPDTVRPFQVNAGKPFHLEFGRGSGGDGLEVVILDESGKTTVSRELGVRGDEWQNTEISLSPKLLEEVAAAINSNRLTALDRMYSVKNLADGTQWVLFISQGTNQKVVYFDNNFPPAIINFAKSVDDILSRGGLHAADWKSGGSELDANLWAHNK